MNNSLTLT